MEDLAYKIAEYVRSIKFSDLSDRVIKETKRRLIDSLGCGINVFNEKSVKATRIVAQKIKNSKGATLLGTKVKSSPDYAAFSNGYAIRYLDWNDTYLSKEPAHPSDNIAGILAVGEWQKSTGREIILAIVLAYEIQCRLCDVASLRARGWDHVNYLLISNTLAVSKLMGLSVEQMGQAVNIVLNNLSTRQNRVGELSNWKAAAAPNSVRNAVFAAMLAKEGFTGPSQMLEGRWGFQNQVSGKFEVNIENFGRMGKTFMIEETYIKKHNAEYHSQSAVDAALKLRSKIKSIDEIESMLIETHEAGFTIIGDRKKEPEKWDPKTKETADHSLPYITTVALMDGEVTENQYKIKRFRNPKTLEFLKRVEVVENPEFTKAYAKDGIINKVTIMLKSGKIFSERVDFPVGHPKNPMSDGEVEEKFNNLVRGKLSREKMKSILDFVWMLEKQKDVGKLFPLLVVK